MKKHNEGFTLVELAITIAITAVVFGGVTTLVLTAFRINWASRDVASSQRVVQVLNDAVYKIAGEATKVEVDEEKDGDGVVIKKFVKINGGTARILELSEDKLYVNGAEVLQNVDFENSTFNYDETNKLLQYTIVINEHGNQHDYSGSVYCRLSSPRVLSTKTLERTLAPAGAASGAAVSGRSGLVLVAMSQLGSQGEILGDLGEGFDSFSEWYTRQKDYDGWEGWNSDTPWCGCFVSWVLDALNRCGGGLDYGAGALPRFADVDKGYQNFSSGTWGSLSAAPGKGDLVFFDLDSDPEPDHVGLVASVAGGQVYTIEGNSDGTVRVRCYDADDPSILAFGELLWTGADAS